MAKSKKGLCYECGKKQELLHKKERRTEEYLGIEITYDYEYLECKVCGEDAYDDRLADKSEINMQKAYNKESRKQQQQQQPKVQHQESEDEEY